jgi:hypothetical protein
MASLSQLRANRANAKRSTGPKTAVGKLKSRYNALKHGLSAKQIIIGDEDPSEYEALLNGLIEDYAPASSLEFELIEQLAAKSWRMRRIPRFEAAIFEFYRAEMARTLPDPGLEARRRAELTKKG